MQLLHTPAVCWATPWLCILCNRQCWLKLVANNFFLSGYINYLPIILIRGWSHFQQINDVMVLNWVCTIGLAFRMYIYQKGSSHKSGSLDPMAIAIPNINLHDLPFPPLSPIQVQEKCLGGIPPSGRRKRVAPDSDSLSAGDIPKPPRGRKREAPNLSPRQSVPHPLGTLNSSAYCLIENQDFFGNLSESICNEPSVSEDNTQCWNGRSYGE